MKRLFPTRNLCVRQRAQYLCALPFYKPRLSNFASHFFARILHLSHSLLSQCRLLSSPAQSRHSWEPHLPTIEFA